MNCPFLKEAHVKYCEKSAFRKMIRIAGEVAEERCATARYEQCAVYQRHPNGGARTECPYLRESMAQYCASAPVAQFIPYSEPLLSRCGSDAYRYCDLYLSACNSAPPAGVSQPRTQTINGIPFPNWLYYTNSHLWLDTGYGGSCHIGVDAFLARALGSIERIAFLQQSGVHRPAAVVTAHGMDLELVFPNSLMLTGCNLYLRAHPQKLCGDPYGSGWLFQGVQLPGQPPVSSGLIRGDGIEPWIEQEVQRMSAFLGQCPDTQRGDFMQDGGVFSPDVVTHLRREDALRLFHEFFRSYDI